MNRNLIKKPNTGRILSLDIMRGFSILGIFLVNMMSFHSPILYLNPHSFWQGADKYTYRFIDIFAQSSFYPLFALLFGYSFVLFREKVVSQGLNFSALALRRLFSLLLIGMLHAFFVWHGDILIQFSLLGFILLFLLALPGETLLFGGVLLYGIPAIFLHLWLFILNGLTPNENLNLAKQLAAERSIQIYQQGSFLEITKQRIIDWLTTNNPENLPFLIVSILPLFLIGAGIAKLKWLEKHQRSIPYFLVFSLCIGLTFKSLPYFFIGNSLAQYTHNSIGGLSLAIFYATAIIKLSDYEKTKKWLLPFATVGRMSMGNYLFQSIVSTMIFYQYGLGLYGKVSLLSGTILVFAIFFLQIWLSQIWLNRFANGPVERLWRWIIYLR